MWKPDIAWNCQTSGMCYLLTCPKFACTIVVDNNNRVLNGKLVFLHGRIALHQHTEPEVWILFKNPRNSFFQRKTPFFNIFQNAPIFRGKSLLELWVTVFLPNWQPPLIFVWITMRTSHTIRTLAQDAWYKLNKD